MTKTKPPYEPIIVGLDVGNATTTVATDGKVRAFFPSFRATVGVSAYTGLPLVKTTGGHISRAKHHAVIGCDALDEPGADTLLRALPEDRAHERYTSDATIDTILVALGSAFPEPHTIGVRLGMGMPVSIAAAHGGHVAQRLKGAYDFTHQGRERRVIFDEVRIFGEGQEAHRLLTPAQLAGPIAIHDIGGRTYNLSVYRDGALRWSSSMDLGIDVLLNRVPGVSPSPSVRWTLMNELRANLKAHAQVRKDLGGLLLETVITWENKVMLESAVRHIVIGGGAAFLAPVLKGRYNKDVITLGDAGSERINALSYAKAMEVMK